MYVGMCVCMYVGMCVCMYVGRYVCRYVSIIHTWHGMTESAGAKLMIAGSAVGR